VDTASLKPGIAFDNTEWKRQDHPMDSTPAHEPVVEGTFLAKSFWEISSRWARPASRPRARFVPRIAGAGNSPHRPSQILPADDGLDHDLRPTANGTISQQRQGSSKFATAPFRAAVRTQLSEGTHIIGDHLRRRAECRAVAISGFAAGQPKK